MPSGIFKRTLSHNKSISDGKRKLDYESIKDLYVNQHMYVIQIARVLNVKRPSVQYALSRMKIRRRKYIPGTCKKGSGKNRSECWGDL